MLEKPVLSRRLLLIVFTLSGFSGLIYESIWSHYLKLFLGHAAYAQTLVLAIFMGGMALGAWLVARSTARIRNLLVMYAVVEGLTGLLALAFHPLYTGAISVAFDSVIPGLESAAAISAFKWSLAGILILPQSILLGTTFPLISGGVIRRYPESSGETLAMLYFTNSLGAAFGVLASGFFLIGRLGLPGTVMVAGVLNILLALFVWMVARDENVPAAKPAEQAAVASGSSSAVRWICAAAFLAGMAAFVYEIAWIRMLSLVLGSSTHAFELMLSAFILGLALGGFWIRKRIAGYARPQRVLAIMFSLMALLAALTIPSYGLTFDVMSSTVRMFDATEPGHAGFNIVSHAIAAALMIPTTIVAGMTLPLMTHYLLRENAGEQSIGKVYAANTVGAIAGVLIAVHLFLPHIGTKGAVIVGALVQAGIAAMLIWREPAAQRTTLSFASLGASVLLVLIIAQTVQLDPMKMASGVYRRGFATLPADSEVIFLRDGKTATITLARQRDTVVIATNGKPDAALNMGTSGAPDPDEITMSLAGALPLMLHPEPRRIANIGIGSGLTSHVALASPKLTVLDSIEIEPAIVEAARKGFDGRVSKLFHDDRSRIHFEDAKTFFATAKVRYDVIISEPSNPWVSGVASLFSTEFYERITHNLAPDGLLVQWVQIYETDITVVASILKALSPHFKDYAIYNTDDSDLLIVASVEKSLPALHSLALEGELAAELRKVGIESLADVEVRRIGSKRVLDPLFASYAVPGNSDYYPFVDLTAPRMRFLRRNAFALEELRLRAIPLLELLGEPGPTPGARVSKTESFLLTRDRTEQAFALLKALNARDVSGLPPAAAIDVLALQAAAKDCPNDTVRDAWYQAVRSLAARTTPYVPASELESAWTVLRGGACAAAATSEQRAWLDFHEAVAGRKTAAIIERGSAMLRDSVMRTADERAEVLFAVAASLLGENRNLEAAQLLQADIALVESRRDTDLAARLLEAIALTRLTGRAAQH
jgi:spermidine synthase